MASIFKQKGSSYWSYDFTINGDRVRRSTPFRNRRDAQKEGDQKEAAARLEFEQSQGLRLMDAADLFFKRKAAKRPLAKKTIDSYKHNLSVVYETLGDIPLATVTEETIRLYVNQRLADGGKVQISREVSFMSSLYTEMRGVVGSELGNPWMLYNKKDIPKAAIRDRVCRDSEVRALLDDCNYDMHKAIIILAIDTGMRKQEILKLHESEVDFEERMIYLPAERTKTRKARSIPMTSRVAESLVGRVLAYSDYAEGNRYYPGWTGFYFENENTMKPVTDIKNFWTALRQRTGIKNLRFHDLRHTFATNGMRFGADQISMMGIMGHESPQSFSRYAKATHQGMRRSTDLIENGIDLA
jgi:integrase/recombinase XerD